jgi:hypothetical protein
MILTKNLKNNIDKYLTNVSIKNKNKIINYLDTVKSTVINFFKKNLTTILLYNDKYYYVDFPDKNNDNIININQLEIIHNNMNEIISIKPIINNTSYNITDLYIYTYDEDMTVKFNKYIILVSNNRNKYDSIITSLKNKIKKIEITNKKNISNKIKNINNKFTIYKNQTTISSIDKNLEKQIINLGKEINYLLYEKPVSNIETSRNIDKKIIIINDLLKNINVLLKNTNINDLKYKIYTNYRTKLIKFMENFTNYTTKFNKSGYNKDSKELNILKNQISRNIELELKDYNKKMSTLQINPLNELNNDNNIINIDNTSKTSINKTSNNINQITNKNLNNLFNESKYKKQYNNEFNKSGYKEDSKEFNSLTNEINQLYKTHQYNIKPNENILLNIQNISSKEKEEKEEKLRNETRYKQNLLKQEKEQELLLKQEKEQELLLKQEKEQELLLKQEKEQELLLKQQNLLENKIKQEKINTHKNVKKIIGNKQTNQIQPITNITKKNGKIHSIKIYNKIIKVGDIVHRNTKNPDDPNPIKNYKINSIQNNKTHKIFLESQNKGYNTSILPINFFKKYFYTSKRK